MSTWNTKLSVIANLEAESEQDALAKLREALTRAGFEIYDGDFDADAFPAEDGSEPTPLPVSVRLLR